MAVMELVDMLDALEREGRLLVDAAKVAGTGAAVPTCPRWRVRDLLAHVGYVHRWAAAYVSDALAEEVDRRDETGVLASSPADDSLVEWVAEGHRALVETLASAPTDVDCWSFLAAPSPLTFWARRQAHETAVHRIDAELAAGATVSGAEPQFAADGIDELLFGFLARRSSRIDDSVRCTIGLDAADLGEFWTVRLDEGRVTSQRRRGDCDVVVRGPAFALYGLCWNRRLPVGLLVSGKAEALETWRQQVAVTWR